MSLEAKKRSAAKVSSRVRVTHVTTNHTPFDTRIFLKECVSLASAGYDVSLVVPYTESLVRNGVRVIPILPPKNRLQRFIRSGFDAFRASWATKAHVYHLHDPDLLPVGWLLKLLGKRVIYDVHEDRPKQVLSKEWIPKPLRPLVAVATRVVESMSAGLFDAIVAATPSIAESFPSHKTTLIQNFPIVGELTPSEERAYARRPLQVVFVGGISAIRGVKQFVDAMGMLPRRLSARLLLIGEFDTAGFHAEVQASPGWKQTNYLGWQDRDAVAKALADSRIGLVTYLPEPNHIAAQPNKLFEYMSAGIPVVASDFPLWREIVEDAGCGVLVDPSSPEQIASAIEWLFDHPQEAARMGNSGREAISKRLNWDAQSDRLYSVYERFHT